MQPFDPAAHPAATRGVEFRGESLSFSELVHLVNKNTSCSTLEECVNFSSHAAAAKITWQEFSGEKNTTSNSISGY